jgi:hypothetical protein
MITISSLIELKPFSDRVSASISIPFGQKAAHLSPKPNLADKSAGVINSNVRMFTIDCAGAGAGHDNIIEIDEVRGRSGGGEVGSVANLWPSEGKVQWR